MKVVLLAGGFGTRLSEETDLKPKPMINIGDMPILWHIMKIYSSHGFNDFVILLGYKGYVIKEYFANYVLHSSNITIDLKNNETKIINETKDPWTITLLETGLKSMTGGRIAQARDLIDGESFLLTYGDGVGDINIEELIQFHKKQGKLMTLTACQPAGRFGALSLDDQNLVTAFQEKPKGDGAWVNAGFFVCENKVLDYIDGGSDIVFEEAPMKKISQDGELSAYKHHGFWLPMDTLRDKKTLNDLYNSEKAPWVSW